MKPIIYCSLVCYVSICGICNKTIDCARNAYSFEAFFKAYPDIDSVRINDTVWLELNTSTQIKDLITSQIIDYSQASNLGTAISYLELIKGINDPAPLPSANFFDNIVLSGSSVLSIKPDQFREFLFTEDAGMYKFKLGIVPKKKGLFAIGPGNATNVYRRTDNCTKAGFSLTFKNTNQHLYLYEQSRPGYIPSEYELTHVYCFSVY